MRLFIYLPIYGVWDEIIGKHCYTVIINKKQIPLYLTINTLWLTNRLAISQLRCIIQFLQRVELETFVTGCTYHATLFPTAPNAGLGFSCASLSLSPHCDVLVPISAFPHASPSYLE